MSAHARLPGLDGLRGVAVLAVIGFHLHLGNFLPAGFLGVDIFFTVSGFIITALLLQEHAQTGRIDFVAFYVRRARRLFPAALAMLLLLVALTPWLLPAALPRLREDLPAAFLYVSNWWQIVAQQSYFEAMEHPRLLQHLWSLAVEEQYYLLWPLTALWLLKRTTPQGLGIVAALIATVSTAWMAWLYTTHIDGGDPSRVYLGTDTHLMGLLIGSSLAAVWNPWAPPAVCAMRGKALDLTGLIALGALIVAMAQLHEGMPGLYQGGFWLVAAVTCVVIGCATHPGNLVARVLSTRPMRWLGARSYSLYLWHWPVVVFLRPGTQADASELAAVTALRLLLTVLCAEASYRWIETPWTRGASGTRIRRIGVGGLALLGVFNIIVLCTMPGAHTPSLSTENHTTSPALEPSNPTVQATPEDSAADSVHDDVPHTSLATSMAPRTGAENYQRLTMVGDSVLLGARPYLLRRLPSASVDAKVGRQGSDGLKLIRAMREEQTLGDAAVIHLGTNGYLVERQFKALLEQLSDRKIVVVINVYGARRWTQPNNEMIARVSQSFPNVQMIDWYAMGQAHPGYFVQDGIHLSGSGIHAYYNQIRMALGLPEWPPAKPKLRPPPYPEKTKATKTTAPPVPKPEPSSPPTPPEE